MSPSRSNVGSQVRAKSRFPRRSRSRRVARDRSRRFAMGLVVVMTAVSLLLGWGLAAVSQAAPKAVQALAAELGEDVPRTVDYVPKGFRLSQQLYLENCATCHIGIPPETLPSESWRNLIQDASHYGTEIRPPKDPVRGLIWSYLRAFSRPKSEREARAPYRLGRSRYFKALHPDVQLPTGLSLQSCETCHRAAQQFSFRPWQDETGVTP